MIEEECAREVYATALKSVAGLSQILISSQGRCSDEKFEELREGVGRSIGEIQMGILEPLILEFPELDDLLQ